jgi:hypothetical protein
MIAFLEDNAHIIALLTIFGANLFILIFKPHLIEQFVIYSSWNAGPYRRRIREPRPPSRFGFLCWGLLFGIDAVGIILCKCGLIDGHQVPEVFLLGFAVCGIGVVYDLARKIKK